MAKLSEIVKDLYEKMGATISAEELKKLDGIEVDETPFNALFEKGISDYGRNRTASVHKLYEDTVKSTAKFEKLLGSDRLTKTQQIQGEKKLIALADAFEEALEEVKAAKVDNDPNASKDAIEKVNKLQKELADVQAKYETYISKDDFDKAISEKDKQIFEKDLIGKFRAAKELSENMKTDARLPVKLADFYGLLKTNDLVVDYATGKITKADGTDAVKGRTVVTTDYLLNEAIGDDRIVGTPPPIVGQKKIDEGKIVDPVQAVNDLRYNRK